MNNDNEQLKARIIKLEQDIDDLNVRVRNLNTQVSVAPLTPINTDYVSINEFKSTYLLTNEQMNALDRFPLNSKAQWLGGIINVLTTLE
jgi:hypothetical protein